MKLMAAAVMNMTIAMTMMNILVRIISVLARFI